MPVSLVIFDCDGVLIDSEPIANRVFMEQLSGAGLALPLDEVLRTFVGRTRDGCIALASEMLGRPLPEGFGAAWDEALHAALRREVRPVAGIPELLDGMARPWCVASNGQRERMEIALEAAGLLDRVRGRLFTAQEVARPKPAPDLFLHAARVMGHAPAATAVVEDTPTGVRAAVAAGMRAFAYAAAPHANRHDMAALGATLFDDMRKLPALLDR